MDAMGRTVPHDLERTQGDACEVSLPSAHPGVFTVLIGSGPGQHTERVVIR